MHIKIIYIIFIILFVFLIYKLQFLFGKKQHPKWQNNLVIKSITGHITYSLIQTRLQIDQTLMPCEMGHSHESWYSFGFRFFFMEFPPGMLKHICLAKLSWSPDSLICICSAYVLIIQFLLHYWLDNNI